MSERKEKNDKLKQIGILFQEKRCNILNGSREAFINDRSDKIFNDADWISLRHLINIENGKNLPSLEMLIKLSIAFEIEPFELFDSIYRILYNKE